MFREVLKTHNLSKTLKKSQSINKINISVRRGEIYALLGRNNSGIDVIVRMLTGLVKPTSGSIELFGKEVKFTDYKNLSRIGHVLATPCLYPNLTVAENIDIHRRLMNVPDDSCVRYALEKLGISEYEHHLVGNLSGGIKQKVALARALAHNPELLILEDPMSGLDPAGIIDIRQLLLDFSTYKHITVVFSTNILSEAEQIATKIGVVTEGSLVDEIDTSDFSKTNRNFIELIVDDIKRALFILEEKMGIHDYKITQKNVICIYNSSENTADINRVFMEEGISVIEIRYVTHTLEDHFLSLTGGRSCII